MLQLLLLIIIANSSPVVARNMLGERWQTPIDFGIELRDGRPLLGRSKTWRGLIAACAACTLAAPLLGVHYLDGLAVALLAMAGDILASFLKRRLGYAPSSQSLLLDSLPEALLPALFLRKTFLLTWLEAAALVVLFAAIVRLTSPLLYRLGIRKRPW